MKKRLLLLFALLCIGQTGVAFAEYNNDTSLILSQYQTNGEYMKNGQALTAIGADKAYTGVGGTAYTGLSGNGVTIALISSGVGLQHEDLQNRILNASFNETDDFGWGSEMAGVIAAGGNSLGLHGVAYGSSLLPFNVSLGFTSIFTALSGTTYNSVKIINSYGSSPVLYVAEHFPDWGKDRLFVSALAISEREGIPSSVLKNNVINVVSYDATKTPGDDHFIDDQNSLAIGAQSWTLAAPGTFYTTDTDDTDQQTKYITASSDNLAGSAVAGAAALVQEAFPQIDGRQIADILFLTALRKDELTLSPYMIQENTSISGQDAKRFLFFTDQNEMEYEAALAEAIAAGRWTACSPGSETCFEEQVTFEDVFGQGLLNVANVTKGPRYLNTVRSDYDSDAGQFFHTVTVPDAELNWTWSNNIAQVIITDPQSEYANKNIGLKKQGAGALTLSGNNTFSGKSVVEQGTLVLTGRMISPVTVNGGKFSLEGGIQNGNIVVNSGDAVIKSGTVTGDVTTVSDGRFSMEGGALTGAVANQGQFTMNAGTVTGDMINTGTFNVTGNATFHGTINNKTAGKTIVDQGKTLTVTSGQIENHGEMTGYGAINGTVTNAPDGTVGTSLTINGTFNSTGTILLERNGDDPKIMNVSTLNITGGRLVLSEENRSLRRGETYTAITYNTLEAFNNFESHRLSDFVVAVPVLAPEEKRIDVLIDFQPLPEDELKNTFSEDEWKTLKIVNNICSKQDQAVCDRFYFYTTDDMKKQIGTLRTKVLPVQNEQLPLTKVMASQVHAHLFTNNIVGNAAEVWRPNTRYRGEYYRGRSGGNAMRYGKYSRYKTSRYNAPPRQDKVWGQFLGGTFKEDGDSVLNRKELTTKSVGAMFGYDHDFSDKFLLGFLAGVSSAKITEGDNEIKLRDYRVGLYTASRFGQVTLNTVLTGGLQKYDSERSLDLLGEKETGIAKYNSYSAEFDINLGYDFMRLPYRDYSFFVRSYLSANVNYLYQDAYKEKGNSFLALGVNSMHNTSVSVSPGLTLGYNFHLFTEMVLTADVSYQRFVSGTETHSSAYFLADTEKTSFPMASVAADKDFVNAGVGLKMKLSRNTQLHLWAGSRTSKRTEALNFAATFSYKF